MTPKWSLTPLLLRSLVWLYPRIIVSKSHKKYIKVCGYSDPFFKNLNQRSLSLDDLWPHICWGHMCDPTQGLLCPSPMGLHQCIQRSILQIFNQDYHIGLLYTTYCTYYVPQCRMSDYIVSFLNKVQARQKSNQIWQFQHAPFKVHLPPLCSLLVLALLLSPPPPFNVNEKWNM